MSRRMRDSRHGAKLSWWRHDVVRWHVTAASPGSLTSYKLPTPFLLKISQLPGIQVVITPHNLSQLISFIPSTLNTSTVWAANQWGAFLVLYETCHVIPQILMYGNYIHNYYISWVFLSSLVVTSNQNIKFDIMNSRIQHKTVFRKVWNSYRSQLRNCRVWMTLKRNWKRIILEIC